MDIAWLGQGRGGRNRQRRIAESGDFWKHFYVRKHKLYSHIWFIYIVKYIYILVHFPRSCSCCWRHIPLRRRFRQRFQFHQMQKKQQQLLLAPTSVKLSRGNRGGGAGNRGKARGAGQGCDWQQAARQEASDLAFFRVDSISLAAFRLLLLLLLLIGCCRCLCCCCHFAMQITRKAR